MDAKPHLQEPELAPWAVAPLASFLVGDPSPPSTDTNHLSHSPPGGSNGSNGRGLSSPFPSRGGPGAGRGAGGGQGGHKTVRAVWRALDEAAQVCLTGVLRV